MLIVLDEKIEERLLRLTAEMRKSEVVSVPDLNATLDAEEGLVRVHDGDEGGGSVVRADAVPIPCLVSSTEIDSASSLPAASDLTNGHAVLFVGSDGPEPVLQAFVTLPSSEEPQPCEMEIVRLETDIFSRLKGIFDTRVLQSKTVAAIGLGSGGAVGAVELAKAGVGTLILADFDRLKAHNVARHVCGLTDVGRYKTRAVRDVILQHNPAASVICHEIDVTQEPELLYEMISASDLVLVGTDTQLSRYLVNEACLELDTPAVYGGAYERAYAGEVVRVIPGEAGCYACVRQNLADTMRSISSQQEFDYTDDSDLEPEPGMGMDVALLAMLQAKVALMTLLRGTDSTVGDIDAQMVIWTNSARPEDGVLFEQPMARHFVKVPKAEDCPACGQDVGETATDIEAGP